MPGFITGVWLTSHNRLFNGVVDTSPVILTNGENILNHSDGIFNGVNFTFALIIPMDRNFDNFIASLLGNVKNLYIKAEAIESLVGKEIADH